MDSEFIRLLRCSDCKTLEELPDFTGNTEDDLTLIYLDERHGGLTETPHTRALLRVERKHWEDKKIRAELHKRIWDGVTGFVPEYYATKDTLKDDAVKCFIRHRRSVPCIDFQEPSKRIGNPAAGLRKWLSKETRNENVAKAGPKLYLCNFCVIQTYVDAAKLKADPDHKY